MNDHKEKVALSSVFAGLTLTLGKFVVGLLTGSMGIDDGQLFTEAQPRTQQRFQLSGCLENVEPSDRAQHALMHLALLAKALDDLQVSIRGSAFDAKIHRAVLFLYRYPAQAR